MCVYTSRRVSLTKVSERLSLRGARHPIETVIHSEIAGRETKPQKHVCDTWRARARREYRREKKKAHQETEIECKQKQQTLQTYPVRARVQRRVKVNGDVDLGNCGLSCVGIYYSIVDIGLRGT